MTLQSLPSQPVAWIPTAGYDLASVAVLISPARAVAVENEAIDEYWASWHKQCDELMLLEYPTPPPIQRLAHYQQKPVHELPPPPPMVQPDAKGQPVLVQQPAPPRTGSWSGQKISFPRDYDEDIQDWIKLEPFSLRRDQVLREIAMLEMLSAGQQGLAAPTSEAPLPQAAPTSGVTPDLPPLPWSAQQQAPPA